MSAAKQGFANDVLSSAKSQMGVGADGSQGAGGGIGNSGAYRFEEDASGLRDNVGSAADANPGGMGGADGQQGGARNVAMNQGAGQEGTGGRRVDADTREGLANIAHGIPHNKFDPSGRTFSGGGFPEFTGENANIIGASQLTPAPGFEQHGVKMRDGSVGTLYQNAQTGEDHVVQFGSVDNGVIQGAISQVDSSSGKFGDFMAFRAVHQSVPGAQSVSSHSVPVADSEGGVYHVATGAATSFFSAGGTSTMPSAADATAHSAGAVSPASTPMSDSTDSAPSSRGVSGDSTSRRSAVSAYDASSINTSRMGAQASDPGAAPSSAKSVSGSTSVFKESTNTSAPSATSPPINTGMDQSGETRRFSKNNPAHVEVFKREGGGVESFNRPSGNSDTVPKMNKD